MKTRIFVGLLIVVLMFVFVSCTKKEVIDGEKLDGFLNAVKQEVINNPDVYLTRWFELIPCDSWEYRIIEEIPEFQVKYREDFLDYCITDIKSERIILFYLCDLYKGKYHQGKELVAIDFFHGHIPSMYFRQNLTYFPLIPDSLNFP